MEPISIHPGVVNGRRVHPLTHTSKPHKGGGKLARKMKRLHARRLDHAETLKRQKVATGFRSPGSMNLKK